VPAVARWVRGLERSAVAALAVRAVACADAGSVRALVEAELESLAEGAGEHARA
jgi:hypothetical protein